MSRQLTLLIAIICIAVPTTVFGGAYGEHKLIGDSALRKIVIDREDSSVIRSLLNNAAEISLQPSVFVSYGDLCALAGDHTLTVNELLQELTDPASHLYEVIKVQHEAIALGRMAASNGEVLLADPDYLPLALKNYSHFYSFGQSLSEHLEDIDPHAQHALCSGEEEALLHTNALAKYVMLHSAALCVAEEAGRLARLHDSSWRTTAIRAIVMNAFADHFLQDAFAPGHLVLRRTVLGSYLTDLSIHDYYNRIGLTLLNARGDVWLAYGDEWMARQPDNLAYAIEANERSIREILAAFEQGRTSSVEPTSVRQLIERNKALHLVPIPYDSPQEIEWLLPDRDPEKLAAINTLDHQGPVVSRLGFGIVAGGSYDLSDTRRAEASAGLALRGIGFDKDHESGSSWLDASLRLHYQPATRTTAYLLEVRNVSNYYTGWRRLLPLDPAIGVGVENARPDSRIFLRVSFVINYFSIAGRSMNPIHALDPKFVFSSTYRPAQPSAFEQLRSTLAFGIELTLNPVLDLLLSYP